VAKAFTEQKIMRYFHVPPDNISGNQVRISGRELHHLMNVLRLGEGDEVTVLDGSGGIYEVVLISLPSGSRENSPAVGEVKSSRQAQPPQVEVTLFQGLPRADKMDLIVQKATELGAHRVVPILCQNTVPRLSKEQARRRVVRWRQIAVEASKQSRRPFFPGICDVTEIDEALKEFPADLKLVFVTPSSTVAQAVPCDAIAKAQSDAIAKAQKKLKDILNQSVESKRIGIFIGPEGDFTEDEIHRILQAGTVAVSLGENVLRTETAAIAALAIVFYEKTDH